MVKEYNVAILGASGAVGTRMREQLEQSTIPVKSLKLLASNRSAGKKVLSEEKNTRLKKLNRNLLTVLIWSYLQPEDRFPNAFYRKQFGVAQLQLTTLHIFEWTKTFH